MAFRNLHEPGKTFPFPSFVMRNKQSNTKLKIHQTINPPKFVKLSAPLPDNY